MATQPFRIPETPDYAGFARQNAMLDFSPITNVMDKWDKQAQLDKENKRAEDQLGFQRERLGMDKEKFSDDRKKNLIESFGNVAMLYDPAKDLDGAQWTGIVNRYDAKMRAHDSSFQGSTPDYYDRVQGPKLILGDSKMAAQQLEYQMRKAAEGRAAAQLGINQNQEARAKARDDAAMTQDVNLPYADRVNVASRYFTPDEQIQGKPGFERYEQYLNTGKVPPRESNRVTLNEGQTIGNVVPDEKGGSKFVTIRDGTEKPPAEHIAKAANFAARMVEGERNVRKVLDGVDPISGIQFNKGQQFGAADLSTAVTAPLPEVVRNMVISGPHQQYRQAAEQWIRAFLRKESGAAIGADEFKRDFVVYFPQPGDGPDVIAQKEVARAAAMSGIAGEAGNYFQKLNPEAAKHLTFYKGGRQPNPNAQPQQTGQPKRVNSVEEAMALPPGTPFITPNGQMKVR